MGINDNINNEEIEEIQATAYVNSQSLFSNSIPSSPNNSASASNFNQLGSRKSSKSKIGETATEEGHYEGIMERFFQSEVRPVYFGKLIMRCSK